MEFKLYKTQEAAVILNLSPRTLEKLRYTGEGPCFVKIGRSVRYQADDLQKFIDDDGYPGPTSASAAT